jgi:hypothetical protein
MKIEKRPTSNDTDQDYEVTFQNVESYNMHEVSVAINAIAAFNRRSFADLKDDKASASERLSRVTKDLLVAGMDIFVIKLNDEANDRSKAGVIYREIQLSSSLAGLIYLNSALDHFVDKTAEVVHATMNSSTGDRDSLDRTLQALIADSMVAILDAEGISKRPSFIKSPNNFGFGIDVAKDSLTSI